MGTIVKCQLCGAEIQGESNFCKVCGHPIYGQVVVSDLVSNEDDATEILLESAERHTNMIYSQLQDSVGNVETSFERDNKWIIHNEPGLKYMDHVLSDSQIEELVRLKTTGIYNKRRTLRNTVFCIIIFLILILGCELFVLNSRNAIESPIVAPPISMVFG